MKAPSNYDALTTWRAIANSNMRMKYDKNIQDCRITENVGTNFVIGY